MARARTGRQTPTRCFYQPSRRSRYKEAVELYESTGQRARPWQKGLLKQIMAVTTGGLWKHSKFGYSVPRRNGKTEVVSIRELWGLKQGEQILHTAHRTTTSHKAWERLLDLTEKAGMSVVSSYKAFGKEHITVSGGGRIEFRTRTSKGGLGEGKRVPECQFTTPHGASLRGDGFPLIPIVREADTALLHCSLYPITSKNRQGDF